MAKEAEVAMEILRYFIRRPMNTDDLEGVARWRLLEEAIHRTVDETQQALHWLVQRGFLEEINTAGGGRLYRINETRRKEARQFLKHKRTKKE